MKNFSIGVVSSSSRLSGVSATSGFSPSTTSLSFLPGNFRYCGPFGAAGAAACACAAGMPPPSGDSGITPPMIAPMAASPVEPRNPRRLVLKWPPPSTALSACCAMTFLPLVLSRVFARVGSRSPVWLEYLRFAGLPQDRRGRARITPACIQPWLPSGAPLVRSSFGPCAWGRPAAHLRRGARRPPSKNSGKRAWPPRGSTAISPS